VSAKLAADFAAWQGYAQSYQDVNDDDAYGFNVLYLNWKCAFEIASQNGVVAFT
jgi:hypothetical protein